MLYTTSTVLMIQGYSHVCLATTDATCAVVVDTISVAASELDTTTMFTSESIFLTPSLVNGLQLHGTTFFDCGDMPRIISSIKLGPRRLLTACLSEISILDFVKDSLVRTCKSND